jgi:Tol biopolymer transport system component
VASSPPAVFIASTKGDWFPQFSPDGGRVVFSSNQSGEGAIWLADADGSNAALLATLGAFATGSPRWSPDGDGIAFHSNPEGQGEIYMVPSAGGKPRNLTSNPANDSFPSFSRDGRWIYFSSNRTGEFRIWKIPSSGGEAVKVTDEVGYLAIESSDGADLLLRGDDG